MTFLKKPSQITGNVRAAVVCCVEECQILSPAWPGWSPAARQQTITEIVLSVFVSSDVAQHQHVKLRPVQSQITSNTNTTNTQSTYSLLNIRWTLLILRLSISFNTAMESSNMYILRWSLLILRWSLLILRRSPLILRWSPLILRWSLLKLS